jgi:hypothetical protein
MMFESLYELKAFETLVKQKKSEITKIDAHPS